jgi:hypothetical protein
MNIEILKKSTDGLDEKLAIVFEAVEKANSKKVIFWHGLIQIIQLSLLEKTDPNIYDEFRTDYQRISHSSPKWHENVAEEATLLWMSIKAIAIAIAKELGLKKPDTEDNDTSLVDGFLSSDRRVMNTLKYMQNLSKTAKEFL